MGGEWEAAAQAALISAAREHAAEVAREREQARQALRDKAAAEAALRALPDALQRAQTAELALKALEDKVLAETVGSDARAAIRSELQALQPPEGTVTDSASAQAAALAAAAGYEAADAEAQAELKARRALFGSELRRLEADGDSLRETLATAQHLHEQTTSELLRSQSAHTATRSELDRAQDHIAQLEQAVAELRADMCSEREARAAALAANEDLSAQLTSARSSAATAARQASDALRACEARAVLLRLRAAFERAMAAHRDDAAREMRQHLLRLATQWRQAGLSHEQVARATQQALFDQVQRQTAFSYPPTFYVVRVSVASTRSVLLARRGSLLAAQSSRLYLAREGDSRVQ
eukprot:464080-Pleurochrysis_carterae.AAC.1